MSQSASNPVPVLYEVDGTTAWITLNRPEKLNALTREMYLEIGRLARIADEDPEVRVVVIRGNGRAFSSGYDLSEGRTSPPGDGLTRLMSREEINGVRFTLWNLSKPVIAMVHGDCLGGACDLALACDLILASEDASFGEPEIRFGGGSAFLIMPYLIGLRRAKELLFTGDRINAREAERIGLINHVVPHEQLEAQTKRLCDHLSRIPQASLRLTKLGINRLYELQGFTEAIQQNAELMIINALSEAPERDQFQRAVTEGGLRSALTGTDWRAGLPNNDEE